MRFGVRLIETEGERETEPRESLETLGAGV